MEDQTLNLPIAWEFLIGDYYTYIFLNGKVTF